MTPIINILSSNINDLDFSRSVLEKEGFCVKTYKDINEHSLQHICQNQPDVVLLDLDLKNSDGIELCHQFKSEHKLSSFVVLYTKHQEDYIQVEAFKAGADAYIVKPINSKLFVRRIEALLKRKGAKKPTQKLTYKDLEIDRETYRVLRLEHEIILPRKEFEILYLLASFPQKIFTREDIFLKVWKNGNTSKNNRIIDVHIRKIREKVDQNIIKTIKGLGYQAG